MNFVYQQPFRTRGRGKKIPKYCAHTLWTALKGIERITEAAFRSSDKIDDAARRGSHSPRWLATRRVNDGHAGDAHARQHPSIHVVRRRRAREKEQQQQGIQMTLIKANTGAHMPITPRRAL